MLASLDALGVGYERIAIDPAYADTFAFCEHYGEPAEHAANTLVVATKKDPKRFAVCVVLATTRLDVNHAVRDLMGSGRLSFASAEEMATLTGMKVGGVTPFALPPGLPLYVDARVTALDWVIMGTGGRDSKLRLDPAILCDLPGAVVVEGLARPRPPTA